MLARRLPPLVRRLDESLARELLSLPLRESLRPESRLCDELPLLEDESLSDESSESEVEPSSEADSLHFPRDFLVRFFCFLFESGE